jgi:pSer/pThr/pTyr-binding forkhead associated (FHA) protein
VKNYYAILEIPVGSDISEIRDSYRRLVQENLWNKEIFADLKEAYEVLSTPGKRREYDQAAFGQSFGDTTVSTASNTQITSRRCPMQAGPQCPVINGRIPSTDAFCPECGFLISTLPTDGFAPVAAETDIAKMPHLEEDGTDRTHRLRVGLNSVGRETADVLLTDKTVSRRHAQVEITESGEAFVEDLGSTNGTRIMETVLAPHDRQGLRDGDSVRFGSISLIARLPNAAPARAAQAAAILDAEPETVETSAATEIPEINPFPTTPEGIPIVMPFAPEPPAEVPIAPSMDAPNIEDEDQSAEEHLAAAPLGRLVGERHGSLVREDLLIPGVTTFGRRGENTIVLRDDPYISGVHAQIIADENACRLTDLGSTNGTFLNGARLIPNEPSVLQAGDKIGIGGLTYLFEPLAVDETQETPIIDEL